MLLPSGAACRAMRSAGTLDLHSLIGCAMAHTRLEDFTQRRLKIMSASEREEFDAVYTAAEKALTEADPEPRQSSPDLRD